jgi:hypothetical protein
MKKLFIYISLIALVVSCSKEFSSDEYGGYEMMTDYMLSEYTTGAALRQISKTGEYQAATPGTSNMSWVMEPHDNESGALTQNVEMYISYNGSFSGKPSTSEILLRTFNRSEMYEGPVGLPRFETSLSLSEALAAMGVNDFGGGDIVQVRFQLNLTNGESYSRSSVTGSMTQSYFRSPFSYPLIIGCEQPAAEIAAQAGTYTIVATDSYGDGWSTGEAVSITVDGVKYRFGSLVTSATTVSNAGNEFADGDDYTWTFTIKPGAQKMTIAWETGFYDDEIGFSLSFTNTAGKSQSVINSGSYPNGADAEPGTVKPLSGMSICY